MQVVLTEGARAGRCARCRFFSVSVAHKDCSWYHSCESLVTKPEGFRTVLVRNETGESVAVARKRRRHGRRRDGPLSSERRNALFDFAHEALITLDHLWSLGFVHRDLSGANLIVLRHPSRSTRQRPTKIRRRYLSVSPVLPLPHHTSLYARGALAPRSRTRG